MAADALMAALVAAADALPDAERALLLAANASTVPAGSPLGTAAGIDHLAAIFGGLSPTMAVRLAAALAQVAHVALEQAGARAEEAAGASAAILDRLAAALAQLDGAQDARRH
ncbi:hypothetical protein [Neoroseomonas rubea]|uniref:hypothetical protein n=1 Tax=Neoroseomonas rubea TaxID=2748666 RepID=UPI0018DFAE92|nr:hypothetical protein [Roseomonas rubea]